MSAVPYRDVGLRPAPPPDPTIDTVPLPVVRPVFVDPSGRRRRLVRRLTVVGCGLLGGYGVVMATALLGTPLPQAIQLPPSDPPSVQATPSQAPPAAPPSADQPPRAQAVAAGPTATQAPPPPAAAPAPVSGTTTNSIPPGQARRRATTPSGKNH